MDLKKQKQMEDGLERRSQHECLLAWGNNPLRCQYVYNEKHAMVWI